MSSTMRARIYLRNSSDKQAKAATIDAQRPDCHKLAELVAPGCPVLLYPDEGVSGDAPLAERAKLHRLLAEVEPGDVVISFAQDRLSRSDDMIEHAAVFGVFQRVGVVVHTVQEGAIDVRDQVGRLRAQLQSDAAASEKRKILARTKAGKDTAATKGRKPQGATPYGLRYSRDNKAWSIDEPAADVVREIYRRLAAGETCARIARELNERGVPVPKWGKSEAVPRWAAVRVWRLATRPTYRGEWSFSGTAIPVPALVDSATWQLVQAQLLAANRRGLRRTQHVYLLDEGTGRCDVCARPLQIRWGATTGQVSYYVCQSRACGLRWRRTVDADAEVWARMVEAIRQPDLLERVLADGRAATGDATRAGDEAASYERKNERLVRVREVLLVQFRKGNLTEEELARELDIIGREREILERSATHARAAAERARVDAASAQSLREAARTIAAEMERSSPAERREAIRDMRPTVRVSNDAIKVHFRLRLPSPTALATPIVLVQRPCYSTENQCETSVTDGDTVEISVSA